MACRLRAGRCLDLQAKYYALAGEQINKMVRANPTTFRGATTRPTAELGKIRGLSRRGSPTVGRAVALCRADGMVLGRVVG